MNNNETHDLGDLVRVTATFKLSGAAVDPTVVKLSIRKPNGEVTTYVYGNDEKIVRDEEGNYYADIDADMPGDWYYRWWSRGTGQAAGERQFHIRSARAI